MDVPTSQRARRGFRASAQEGFTMVELVAALGVLAVLMSAVAGVFYAAMRTAGSSNRRADGVAVAIRDIEAMHAIPWDQLGFSPVQSGFLDSFEGLNTVVVTNPQISPSATAAFRGTVYNIARHVVWADAPANEATPSTTYSEAYKRVTAVVTWAHGGRLNSARQDSIIYPGGRGAYTGPKPGGSTSTTVPTGDPAPPTGLVASVPAGVEGETAVRLSWSPPVVSSPPVDRWVIEYNASPGTQQWQSVTSDQPVSNPSFTVTDLAPGRLYDFRVRSKAANGKLSTPSNVVQATTNSSNPAVCEAARLTVSPATVTRVSGNSGKLGQEVAVTVNTLGPCSSLEIRYSPDAGVSRVAYMTASGSVWTGALSRDERWSVGNHPLEVHAGAVSKVAIAVGNVCVKQTEGSKC